MSHMFPRLKRAAESEAGGILIFVAIAVFVLTALSAFVLDFGVLWLSRRQAQNSADAGALAGATALSFENSPDYSATGPAYLSALQTSQTNLVFNTTPGVHVDVDPNVAWEHSPPPICGSPPVGCVQVDVFRDGTHDSTVLPTWFAVLLGQSSQSIRATATAMCSPGNSSRCLRPWMIPDKWIDANHDGEYTPGGSEYDPDNGIGGYKATPPTDGDLGTEVIFKPGTPQAAISPGDFFVVDIDPNCTGADCYEESISTCAGVQHTIGDTLRTEPGSMVGPTKFGSNDLVAQDPNAYFDTSTGKVMKPGPNGPVDDSSSPRIIPLAMFSPEEFANLDRTSGRFDLHIVNMLGFFLEGVDNQGYVRGVIVLKIDNFIGSGGVPGSNAAFLKTIALVR